MIRLLFSLVLLAATVAAEPRRCIDTLGAAKYGKELRVIPNNICIGGFARTFGDFFPVAKAELDAGRECIRVNLIWSDNHAFSDKDMKFITSESKRYNILCAAFPDRHIEIAPLTEHNLKNPDKFLAAVKKNAPNCGKPVNTPWNGGLTRNPAYKNEVHGGGHEVPRITGTDGKPMAFNFSDDGTNSVDTDWVKTREKFADADMVCVWHPRLNLKWSMKDPTPRPERKALPSKDLISSLIYLFTEKRYVYLPPKWLLKSHADCHGASDPKCDKLLIISPLNGDAIVLRKDGIEIGRLNYYGVFDGGGYRFYAPKMGWKYGRELEVWMRGKKWGVVNTGFRQGNFR